MNLAALRAEVHRRTGIAVDTDALTAMVNEAAAALAAEFDWPWQYAATTFTTVPGQGSYPTPAGWTRTRSLAYRGATLDHGSIRDLEGAWTPAAPTWTVEGDQLHLVPTPRSAMEITHRYVAAETPMVNDDDEPRLPGSFSGALTSYAAYLVSLRAEDHRRAELFLADYRLWLGRMRDDVRRKTGPFRIRVRPGYEAG